jgi:hypothetical protein
MMRASLGRCGEQRTDARQPPMLTRMTLSVGAARRSRRWFVRRPAEERGSSNCGVTILRVGVAERWAWSGAEEPGASC